MMNSGCINKQQLNLGWLRGAAGVEDGILIRVLMQDVTWKKGNMAEILKCLSSKHDGVHLTDTDNDTCNNTDSWACHTEFTSIFSHADDIFGGTPCMQEISWGTSTMQGISWGTPTMQVIS